MDWKKVLMATLAGFVVIFGLGYLIYVVLFAGLDFSDGTAAGVKRDPLIFPGIILMEIVISFLITYIFAKWAGIKTFAGGLKAAALIGFLLALAQALLIYSQYTVSNINGVVWWTLTSVLRLAIAGGVIGYILGRDETG